MSVNVPLLRKMVEWVEEQLAREENEREWYQGAWCGTKMCVAGYVALVEGWTPVSDQTVWCKRAGESAKASKIAKEALGLTYEQADDLFFNSIDATPEREAANIRRIAEAAAGKRL